MQTDYVNLFAVILFALALNTKYVFGANFIRLLELENTLPSEPSLSDFQTSFVTCISVCDSNIQCRAFFYNTVTTRCRHYDKFDYKQLGKEDNSACYAISLTDIAQGKATQQSSTFGDHQEWVSSLAVDGSMLTSFDVGYIVCTATAYNDTLPWWYVDLSDVYRILTVKLLTREDDAGHRLADIDVVVGLNTSHFGMFCANYYGPAREGELVALQCEPHVLGRYVKVMRSRRNIGPSWDYWEYVLSLCEVMISVVEN